MEEQQQVSTDELIGEIDDLLTGRLNHVKDMIEVGDDAENVQVQLTLLRQCTTTLVSITRMLSTNLHDLEGLHQEAISQVDDLTTKNSKLRRCIRHLRNQLNSKNVGPSGDAALSLLLKEIDQEMMEQKSKIEHMHRINNVFLRDSNTTLEDSGCPPSLN